jgi:hypothetical protein
MNAGKVVACPLWVSHPDADIQGGAQCVVDYCIIYMDVRRCQKRAKNRESPDNLLTCDHFVIIASDWEWTEALGSNGRDCVGRTRWNISIASSLWTNMNLFSGPIKTSICRG